MIAGRMPIPSMKTRTLGPVPPSHAGQIPSSVRISILFMALKDAGGRQRRARRATARRGGEYSQCQGSLATVRRKP